MRYVVFECRKCGHNLYVENTVDVVKTIGRVSNSDCPHCGEESEGNWVLVCLSNNSYYPEKCEEDNQ